MTTTQQQMIPAIDVIRAIAEAIRSLGEVPSGHLYNSVMSVMSLDAYNGIINQLAAIRWVRKSGDLLIWSGPCLD